MMKIHGYYPLTRLNYFVTAYSKIGQPQTMDIKFHPNSSGHFIVYGEVPQQFWSALANIEGTNYIV